MKLNVLMLIMLGILSIVFSTGNLIEVSNAESDYSISISDTSYEFVKTREAGGSTWVYYNISIVLHNSGSMISDDITLEIVGDDEIPLYDNDTIAAGGYRVFTFENFFFHGLGDHQVNISFFPTEITIQRTPDNFGNASFIIPYGGEEESTPGFEFVALLVASFLVFLRRRF